MQQELKLMIFKTIEDHLTLKEFESWLYAQEELSLQMSDDLILELFSFNYNQSDAMYAFGSAFLPYLDQEEFMLWKVKTNLQDLIDGKDTRDRILNQFRWMDDFPFLQHIGYFMYALEDAEYFKNDVREVIERMRTQAKDVLQEILTEESKNPEFKISLFKTTTPVPSQSTGSDGSKEWWKFWK